MEEVEKKFFFFQLISIIKFRTKKKFWEKFFFFSTDFDQTVVKVEKKFWA